MAFPESIIINFERVIYLSEYIKQNFIKGQTLKADHMNYIEDGIVSIEERMEGLPYVEKTESVLEFNGDLTGMEYVIGEGGMHWVKVTDKAYTKEELVGSVIRVTCEDDRMECPTGTWEYTLTEDDVIIQEDIGSNYIVAHKTVLVTIVTPEAELPEGFDMTAGMFFAYVPDMICVHSISCVTGTTETIHPLDSKFLPEGLSYVETTTLFPEFDGNLTNKETVEWNGYTYVKLSSAPISKEDMVGMTLMGNQNGVIFGEPLNEQNIAEDEMNGIKVVYFSAVLLSVFGDIATDEVPFTKGVWAMYRYDDSDPDYPPDIMYVITIKGETIHPLDEKFLPESVDGVIIRSSTEGSTKKFKLTVDDAGTVTATEV